MGLHPRVTTGDIALKKALVVAAIGEIVTGLGLILVPSLVAQLLLGEELAGAAIAVARVAGIALVGLGVACWPGPPVAGMLLYGAAVTIYLAFIGVVAGQAGIVLWPAVALHFVLTIFLARVTFLGRK